MAKARDIVNRALRMIGRLGAGREPRLADANDALAALSGLYTAWIAAGAFGRLADVVPAGGSVTATGNQRIFRKTDAVMDVVLPETVSDLRRWDYGWCRVGCREGGQPPRDGSPVLISDSFTGETISFLYDGTVKKWQSLDGLVLDSDAPRSDADPGGLAAMLAVEIADQFGADLAASTVRAAARYQTAMTHRYGMSREAAVGVYF